MQISAKDLATMLGGRVEGDPDVIVTHPSKIEDGGTGSISFFANPKYEPYVYSTTASVVLVAEDFQPGAPVRATLIRVPDVRTAVSALLARFGEPAVSTPGGVSAQAFVHPAAQIDGTATVGMFTIVERGARLGKRVVLHPQVYVGPDVEIGDDTVLYPGVRIYAGTRIGARCIIHSNAVIGCDGFGFAPQSDGSYAKVPHVGHVQVEDDVEIGSCTTIDRATLGVTRIGSGVKLDNHIQIAHNVSVGKNTVIAAQAGIAGSTSIGERCMIGGQAGIVGHLRIADGVKVQAQSGVNANIETENAAVYGSPALEYGQYVKSYVVFRKLPELEKRLRLVEKKQEQA